MRMCLVEVLEGVVGDGLWWLLVAVGDGGKSLGRWKWFLKKEGEGNGVFPRLHEKQRLKHSSASACGKGSVPHTLDVVSKIATVRSWKMFL